MSFVCLSTTPRPVLLLSTLFYSLAHEKCFLKERKEWNHTGIIGAVGSNGLQLLKKSQGKVERERKELRGKWGQKCCLPSPEEEKTVEVLWYLLTSCSPSSSSSCTFWDIFLPCSLTTGHMITQDSFSSLFSLSFFPFLPSPSFLEFSQPERQTKTVCWLVCRPR